MTLTVIIRDDGPLLYLNEPVAHRSVRIELTAEQVAALVLRHKNEAIGQCFIEPE